MSDKLSDNELVVGDRVRLKSTRDGIVDAIKGPYFHIHRDGIWIHKDDLEKVIWT